MSYKVKNRNSSKHNYLYSHKIKRDQVSDFNNGKTRSTHMSSQNKYFVETRREFCRKSNMPSVNLDRFIAQMKHKVLFI
jgi:hypothetical protein